MASESFPDDHAIRSKKDFYTSLLEYLKSIRTYLTGNDRIYVFLQYQLRTGSPRSRSVVGIFIFDRIVLQ